MNVEIINIDINKRMEKNVNNIIEMICFSDFDKYLKYE